jgi:hypothetical protein
MGVFGSRRRKEARLAAAWERAWSLGATSPRHHPGVCSCLGLVTGHRQRARTGTKAYVRWCVDGDVTAAWFEAARPPVGALVLATGRYGHGPHHDEGVFYVDGPGFFELIPGDARQGYLRHQKRLAKLARSAEKRSQRAATSATA